LHNAPNRRMNKPVPNTQELTTTRAQPIFGSPRPWRTENSPPIRLFPRIYPCTNNLTVDIISSFFFSRPPAPPQQVFTFLPLRGPPQSPSFCLPTFRLPPERTRTSTVIFALAQSSMTYYSQSSLPPSPLHDMRRILFSYQPTAHYNTRHPYSVEDHRAKIIYENSHGPLLHEVTHCAPFPPMRRREQPLYIQNNVLLVCFSRSDLPSPSSSFPPFFPFFLCLLAAWIYYPVSKALILTHERL